MSNYAPGTRIYYTGDMANLGGTGTITAFYPRDEWGPETVDILMDEERFEGDEDRLWRKVSIRAFSPSPGRRFWLLDDWEADRKRRIEESAAAMRAAARSPRYGGDHDDSNETHSGG